MGAKEVLKLVPEKATFLSALQPRDCLRLLGMVSNTTVEANCCRILHASYECLVHCPLSPVANNVGSFEVQVRGLPFCP